MTPFTATKAGVVASPARRAGPRGRSASPRTACAPGAVESRCGSRSTGSGAGSMDLGQGEDVEAAHRCIPIGRRGAPGRTWRGVVASRGTTPTTGRAGPNGDGGSRWGAEPGHRIESSLDRLERTRRAVEELPDHAEHAQRSGSAVGGIEQRRGVAEGLVGPRARGAGGGGEPTSSASASREGSRGTVSIPDTRRGCAALAPGPRGRGRGRVEAPGWPRIPPDPEGPGGLGPLQASPAPAPRTSAGRSPDAGVLDLLAPIAASGGCE